MLKIFVGLHFDVDAIVPVLRCITGTACFSISALRAVPFDVHPMIHKLAFYAGDINAAPQ